MRLRLAGRTLKNTGLNEAGSVGTLVDNDHLERAARNVLASRLRLRELFA